MIKLHKLTVPELDEYREMANFTDDQLECFNMKAKNYSVVRIAMEMKVSESTVCRLTREINEKIVRLDERKERLNESKRIC